MGIQVINCSKDLRQLPKQTKQISCTGRSLQQGGCWGGLGAASPGHRHCKFDCFADAYSFYWSEVSPWVLHKHSHGSGRQHVPELKGLQTKFSSQLRLCVVWVSHSIPDLSFPCLWFWLFMSSSSNTSAICIGLEQDEKHSENSTILQEHLLRSLKWKQLVLLTGLELLVNILPLYH